MVPSILLIHRHEWPGGQITRIEPLQVEQWALSRSELAGFCGCPVEAVRFLRVGLLFGSGLRLIVSLSLRDKDLDFQWREFTVRDGKGGKVLLMMLTQSLVAGSQEHLLKVRHLHQSEVAAGWGRVLMPYALARKYPNADREWDWQWVLPDQNRWHGTASRTQGRHHLDPRVVQKALKLGTSEAGITKAASCHTFRF